MYRTTVLTYAYQSQSESADHAADNINDVIQYAMHGI